MEYTVTDMGDYEEITLIGWGEATDLEAAYAVYGDIIGAVILEPEDRSNPGAWDEDAERRFRNDVMYFVRSWENVPDVVVSPRYLSLC